MANEPSPAFVWRLFNQLRRHRFPLSMEDYDALRISLRSGFGWESREALLELLCLLWAKSRYEKEILVALFNRLHDVPQWSLPGETDRPGAAAPSVRVTPPAEKLPETSLPDSWSPDLTQVPQVLQSAGRLPALDTPDLPESHFVFVPELPLTYREIAQSWRRFRQPVRAGPPEELDIAATLKRRVHAGTVTDIVLIPRRKNNARLILLIDRRGSMRPYHPLVDLVEKAIRDVSSPDRLFVYYFHDTPADEVDESPLDDLPDRLFPDFDPVIKQIQPFSRGTLFKDPQLRINEDFDEVFEANAGNAAVVIISDAGAARGSYDVLRLLDTIAFLKAVKSYTSKVFWLNPVPAERWRKSTASQVKRYVMMLPLDRAGLDRTVELLQGRPYSIDNPL